MLSIRAWICTLLWPPHWRLGLWNFTSSSSEWKKKNLSEMIRQNFSSKTYLMAFKFGDGRECESSEREGEREGGRRGTERNTCERNTSCCLSKCGYQTLNAHGQTVFKKYKKKKMLLYFISMNKCHWDLTFSCSLHSCCSVAARPSCRLSTSAGREDARCRMSQFLPWFSEILWGIIHY